MRHIYLFFVAALAVVVAGFWPSATGAVGPLSPMSIVHGIVATLWMVMLIVQTWLIGRRGLAWHRAIGRASYVVAPLLIGSALVVVAGMLGPNSHFDRDLRLTLAWLDLWSLLLFTLVYALAIRFRRVWPIHGRLMATTALIALPPAVGRLYAMNVPAFDGLAGALVPTYLTVDLVIVVLLARDLMRARHLVWPYALLLVGSVVPQLFMFAAPHWAPFVALAGKLGLPPL